MCGYMFFDTGSNVKLTTSTKNYVVYKEVKATATQTVKPAISLSVIGVPDSMKISCTSTVVISNADDFIRNTDFVFHNRSGYTHFGAYYFFYRVYGRSCKN